MVWIEDEIARLEMIVVEIGRTEKFQMIEGRLVIGDFGMPTDSSQQVMGDSEHPCSHME